MTDTDLPASAKPLPAIAYVDEKEDERSNFFNDAFDSGYFSEIHLIEAYPKISDTLSILFELQIDAFITDFNLTEEGPVGYSGEHLVERILAVRQGFPCFIRTSYEEDALAVSVDVNRVYSKNEAADEHAGSPLFKRVSLQIQKHHHLMDEWRDELSLLLDIPAAERTATDVSMLLELDTKLEAAMGADAAIPFEVKKEIFSKRNDLHARAKKLIADMKRELGD